MRKSTFCGNSNSCVFVGGTPFGTIRVGGSEEGPHLTFSPEEWDVFVKGVKAGEFDTERLVHVPAPGELAAHEEYEKAMAAEEGRTPGLVDESN